jgi:hypothetical protein
MNRILSIDPSGTGTSGLFFTNGTKQEFFSCENRDWKEHLKFLIELIKEKKPNLIIYEHTNYINLKGKDMTSLFKLLGSIETLSCVFNFIQEINNIPVDQVKRLYRQIYQKEKEIKGLTYQIGRGKGWMFESKRISKHELDALLAYYLFIRKL